MTGIIGEIVDNPALGIFFGDDTPETPTAPAPDTTQTAPSTIDLGPIDMRFMTFNVQGFAPDLSRSNVIKCGRLVSHKFTVGGIQELGDKGQDRLDFLNGLGNDYDATHLGNIDVQTQIAYLKNSVTLGKGGYQLAIPGNQPYPNPPRGWVWQEFIPTHGPEFLAVCTHFVNKAWNNIPDGHKQLRRANWNKHHAMLQAWLKERQDALPIILMGDFNRTNVTFEGMSLMQSGDSAHNIGIDKIFASVPQGYRLTKGASEIVRTPSDHDANIRQIKIERKRAS